MLKVVIDTNIFVSGVLTEGIPSIVIKSWKRTQKYTLFITEEILDEIIRVMKKLNINADIIADWDKVIRKNAVNIKPARKITAVKDDPSDNKFLECAVESKADYIVSGDKHLQKLNSFEGIKIVTARQFLDILKVYKENQ